jgi:hypothetical protein
MNNDCLSKEHEEQNKKLYSRNIPSSPLQPYLEVRPVMTKYSYLPIVDPRRELNTKLVNYPTFNPHKTFNPGNAEAPWSGFASNINKESELRNQIYALQSCSQSVYVPSSNSDLYQHSFQAPNSKYEMTHSLLFKDEQFADCDRNPHDMATNMFMNSTRTQVKDLTVQKVNKHK